MDAGGAAGGRPKARDAARYANLEGKPLRGEFAYANESQLHPLLLHRRGSGAQWGEQESLSLSSLPPLPSSAFRLLPFLRPARYLANRPGKGRGAGAKPGNDVSSSSRAFSREVERNRNIMVVGGRSSFRLLPVTKGRPPFWAGVSPLWDVLGFDNSVVLSSPFSLAGKLSVGASRLLRTGNALRGCSV